MMDGQLVTLAYGYIDGRSIDEQMDELDFSLLGFCFLFFFSDFPRELCERHFRWETHGRRM